MLGDVQEVYDAIEKEKELVRKFVHDAYKDVMENYDSRIVKFKINCFACNIFNSM